jgi:hypothetical protein
LAQSRKGAVSQQPAVDEKLAEAEFTRRAIVAGRKAGWKGLHTVYGGYNQAFREYYGSDPIVAVNRMVTAGVIESHYAKGGAMIYLPGEMSKNRTGSSPLLGKILQPQVPTSATEAIANAKATIANIGKK